MFTIDEVEEILEELMLEVPKDFFKGLNGGVVLREEIKYHPRATDQSLYVMGTYSRCPVGGCHISIYYGSFMQAYGHLDRPALKNQLRDTLFHEFTHHLEARAGVRDLEVKDEEFLKKWGGD